MPFLYLYVSRLSVGTYACTYICMGGWMDICMTH
jgi:hypothetical protein